MTDEYAASLFYRAARPREAVEDGRAWLLDCYDEEEDQDEIRTLNAIGIFQAVHGTYEGGWIQFLTDGRNLKRPEPGQAS